jgi:ubiquinone/menaquinone biosynthesis C-methylase UbiE
VTSQGCDYAAVRTLRTAPVQLIAGTGRTVWHLNDGVRPLSRPDEIAEWAWEIVTGPGGGGPLQRKGSTLCAADRPVGEIQAGILRFNLSREDPSTNYYTSIGGANFHERAAVTYAMSSLDTAVYHDYLQAFAPDDLDALVVDIGGGDGRNALPWLQWGFRRVAVIDSTVAGLTRFRDQIARGNPQWLERLLLIQCDARALPLAADLVDRVFAIESLYYLNEDYELGLGECHRVMRPRARLLLADRSYEGALLTRLLYFGGVTAMLETAHSLEMWDGQHEPLVRTRFFSRRELHALVAAQGFEIIKSSGISAFSLLMSFLSKLDRLGPDTETQLAAVHRLLVSLGHTGCHSRCHVVIAEKCGAAV